jgi:hypothetical protein
MRIRDLRPSDIDVLKAIHNSSGLDYDFPELDNMASMKVAVDENDAPIGALMMEPVLTGYLFLDKQWSTPRWRLEAVKALGNSTRGALQDHPIKDVFLFLPPEMAKSFGRKITALFGFISVNWSIFYTRLRN